MDLELWAGPKPAPDLKDVSSLAPKEGVEVVREYADSFRHAECPYSRRGARVAMHS